MKSLITAFVFIGILVSCNSTDKSKNTTQKSSEIETSIDSTSNKVTKQLTESDELLPIMYRLMADMNQINEGIFIENYPMIDSAAYRIATHLKINPAQMQTIKKNLGEDIQEFVRIDMVVHDRAVSISEAAQQKKMSEILSQYDILQQSCVNCHNQFRSRLRGKLQ
ncbi:hypothetical protein [Gillisia limnaea]|uniref:Cytochrome c n=1 Tax=Gillisia limnaea (strain DSM 15749 / LMG 21470 / R-8282) TaxID=865937 RepID=H2BW38_GILLR|nr:hypothetical protein [Gillisia limnaea]EHQ02955.1 hypothetical protein Gilli_2327 [Gillisia limnaea DSM 15749]